MTPKEFTANDFKTILDNLKPDQKRGLQWALELGTTRYVEYADGCFIGVHISPLNTDFKIIFEYNRFSIGTLHKDKA